MGHGMLTGQGMIVLVIKDTDLSMTMGANVFVFIKTSQGNREADTYIGEKVHRGDSKQYDFYHSS